MSGQQGKWREDQILVICPGSHTTMAQLGCSELTPPAHRIPTRMFKDAEDDDEEGGGGGAYRPYYTYKRRKSGLPMPTPTPGGEGKKVEDDEDDYEWVEDRDSVEGAVYPLQGAFGILLGRGWLAGGRRCFHGEMVTLDYVKSVLVGASLTDSLRRRSHREHGGLPRLSRPRARLAHDDLSQHTHSSYGLATMVATRLRDDRTVHIREDQDTRAVPLAQRNRCPVRSQVADHDGGGHWL